MSAQVLEGMLAQYWLIRTMIGISPETDR